MLSTSGGLFAMDRSPSQARRGQGQGRGEQESSRRLHGHSGVCRLLQRLLSRRPAPLSHHFSFAASGCPSLPALQLDSLASTWYGGGDEQEPVAAAVTLLPATPEGMASSYGSFPLQPLLPASLPRASAPVLALHRAQGSSLLAAQMAASMLHSLPPAPRPAGSSNAVRSTAEYGRLDAHQREQAEVGWGVGGPRGGGCGREVECQTSPF